MSMKDDYGLLKDRYFFGLLLAFGLAAIVALGGVFAAFEQQSCLQIGEQTNHETNWSLFTGCLVNVDGQWVPIKNWIYNNGN